MINEINCEIRRAAGLCQRGTEERPTRLGRSACLALVKIFSVQKISLAVYFSFLK